MLLSIPRNTHRNLWLICKFTPTSDGGLPFSPFFSKVHPKLKVPLHSLYLNLALVIIFGLIFLGSSSAFNAIISASVVLLDLAYGIPIAINCLRGRNTLPERSFVLPNALGWVLNTVWHLSSTPYPSGSRIYVNFCCQISLIYITLTTVLFLFPPDLPATGSNMSEFSLFLKWIFVFDWFYE